MMTRLAVATLKGQEDTFLLMDIDMTNLGTAGMPSMTSSKPLSEQEARGALVERGYEEQEVADFIRQAKLNPI
jgi:hypothetical protein